MWTDEDLRNHMPFHTRRYFPARSSHSLLEGIFTEVEQMLPQIKLMQAVGRVFPGQSGQHKHGSSKKKEKKKKKERARSNLVAQELWSWATSVCVHGFPAFQARGPPLFAALDTSLPGGLEWLPHAKLHGSQKQGQRDAIRYPQCQRGSIRTRSVCVPSYNAIIPIMQAIRL